MATGHSSNIFEPGTLVEYSNALTELSKCEAEIATVEDNLKTLGEDKIRALGELKRVGELKDSTDKQIVELKAEISSADEKKINLNAINPFSHRCFKVFLPH